MARRIAFIVFLQVVRNTLVPRQSRWLTQADSVTVRGFVGVSV